jgi:uncharacterized protein (UPF0297 family)
MLDFTRKFDLTQDKDKKTKETLTAVYDALKEKGYNPINQLVGYILSEDPTYITNYNNARALIRKLDRLLAASGTRPALPDGQQICLRPAVCK